MHMHISMLISISLNLNIVHKRYLKTATIISENCLFLTQRLVDFFFLCFPSFLELDSP